MTHVRNDQLSWAQCRTPSPVLHHAGTAPYLARHCAIEQLGHLGASRGKVPSRLSTLHGIAPWYNWVPWSSTRYRTRPCLATLALSDQTWRMMRGNARALQLLCGKGTALAQFLEQHVQNLRGQAQHATNINAQTIHTLGQKDLEIVLDSQHTWTIQTLGQTHLHTCLRASAWFVKQRQQTQNLADHICAHFFHPCAQFVHLTHACPSAPLHNGRNNRRGPSAPSSPELQRPQQPLQMQPQQPQPPTIEARNGGHEARAGALRATGTQWLSNVHGLRSGAHADARDSIAH